MTEFVSRTPGHGTHVLSLDQDRTPGGSMCIYARLARYARLDLGATTASVCSTH
ncbi:MAG: hypothetical protein WCT12_19245 [Verrucomicrobiota bacterium]